MEHNGSTLKYNEETGTYDYYEYVGNQVHGEVRAAVMAEHGVPLAHQVDVGGAGAADDLIAEKAYCDNFTGTFSRVQNGKPTEFTEYILAGPPPAPQWPPAKAPVYPLR